MGNEAGVPEGDAVPDLAASAQEGTGIGASIPPASGERAADEQPSALTFEDRVRNANQDFLRLAQDHLNLPIQILIEQRDVALSQLSQLAEVAAEERQRLMNNHERFVGYLMEEQLANLRHVREQLDAANEELQRTKALAALPTPDPSADTEAPASTDAVETTLEGAQAKIEQLRRELAAAYQEIDETRAEAIRLQDEHDEAIRTTDDVQFELRSEIDAARDEAFDIQARLDATLRQLEDAHDARRDDALRMTEELDDLKRELHERNAEVRRLRERLQQQSADQPKYSRPPPPDTASELDGLRKEVKYLRQQLILAKRELSQKSSPDVGRAAPGLDDFIQDTKTSR